MSEATFTVYSPDDLSPHTEIVSYADVKHEKNDDDSSFWCVSMSHIDADPHRWAGGFEHAVIAMGIPTGEINGKFGGGGSPADGLKMLTGLDATETIQADKDDFCWFYKSHSQYFVDAVSREYHGQGRLYTLDSANKHWGKNTYES